MCLMITLKSSVCDVVTRANYILYYEKLVNVDSMKRKEKQIMNFKKGDKTVHVPTLAVVAGAVVVTDVVRNICKTVVKKSKNKQQ